MRGATRMHICKGFNVEQPSFSNVKELQNYIFLTYLIVMI